MKVDYGQTLNLPKTDFPMRANLPQKEPEIMKSWYENDIYNKRLKRNEGHPKFVLHDGPPYANGDIHLGTALNKVLKDIIVRYYDMKGYYAPYVPGWDTHGLPTENRAIDELGLNRHEVGPVKFRKACEGIARKYIDIQRESFKRLGVVGDWEHPYITLLPQFEAKQIEVFGKMAERGCIYKGLRPVYWCPCCETALAEAEIEYMEEKNQSIYVKFALKDDKGKLKGIVDSLDNTYIVIWTTTTWTLPGNVAIAVNPDFVYAVIKAGNENYIMAKELAEATMKVAGIENYSIIGELTGAEMEYMVCRHPFLDRDSLVITGDHVTLDAGTGCVHTAPGHGVEDFEVCRKYEGLKVIVPVDGKGVLTEDAGQFAGLTYKQANKEIFKHLKETGALFADQVIEHQYPHCWRCKQPILFRATEQWFISVESFKKEALEAIKQVRWIPEWGEERISKMVAERNDWCISRQRMWGVPIPIFYCTACGKELINSETIEAVKTLFEKEGSTAWFEKDASEILPAHIKCSCGNGTFRKETDIMDVWFDSGSSHAAVLETNPQLSWPADMYLEGSDQHRGWFQSSLLTAVATKGMAPYKQVLTHGYVVDGQGRKMSKSLGNGIDPMDIVNQYGADILRLWVASSDYKTDIRISNDIIKQLAENYRKIRNTARFILGNISDFDPETMMVPYYEMEEIDKWALMRLNGLIRKVEDAFSQYEFHSFTHNVHNFCVVDMSNFYLDVLKDRLYVSSPDDKKRRSAQTAMYIILDSLVRLLAPILAFTSEEIWKYLPHRKGDNPESIQLNSWPVVNPEYDNPGLEQKWNRLIEIRDDVLKALENARNEKVIGASLEAEVRLKASGDDYKFLQENRDLLSMIFIVSNTVVEEDPKAQNIEITIVRAEGEKCERCWVYSPTVGKNEKYPTLCSRCAEILG
ncbi:isoleucine--tRNA ligase [Thermoclostridium stercorarium subsp. leptospartum DSM 9219]|uniref:Isoleucine--tRNA ligase n=1 Tax=Thermoclostridium stercorarium subsp. leptospartum DSM 9219 TaxID=1346611 RepID=A0A1B1YPB1_THEST|nr:isoleucine--tRNA ligase [Thermoclostridium stercorarium]ANX02607.1 isoleucine--tRNA ligase [Thermoclostridium stercorarium subsp. leptospartum DSM 9219]